MITTNDANVVMQPGKTMVSVALLKEYDSGTPVFVKCYRKSNTWTLPHMVMDYTNTTHPAVAMIDVIADIGLDRFDILSAEPIADIIDEDCPSRIMMYLVKAGKGIDAYQLYTTPDNDTYRLSRFMHQNQIFSMHKAILLNLYVKYLRSV